MPSATSLRHHQQENITSENGCNKAKSLSLSLCQPEDGTYLLNILKLNVNYRKMGREDKWKGGGVSERWRFCIGERTVELRAKGDGKAMASQ